MKGSMIEMALSATTALATTIAPITPAALTPSPATLPIRLSGFVTIPAIFYMPAPCSRSLVGEVREFNCLG